MFQSFVFKGEKAGVHVLILGAVHGNEVAGTLAQRQIIEEIKRGELKLKSGSVTFIPVVNEAAHKADIRFIDINLNRVVCHHENPQNNEEKIANELIKVVDSCDVMLDLHSTHCEGDEAFAFIDYPDEGNLKLLALMPVQTALAGWPAIYANSTEIDNYSTEEYCHTHKKCGITLECGYHKADKATAVARSAILNVLSHYGILDLPKGAEKMPRIITLDSFVIKQGCGHMVQEFKHLDWVCKGQIIAEYEDGGTVVAPDDGYIIMPNPNADIGAEWFYFGQ